jgi:hypothetical protein
MENSYHVKISNTFFLLHFFSIFFFTYDLWKNLNFINKKTTEKSLGKTGKKRRKINQDPFLRLFEIFTGFFPLLFNKMFCDFFY